MGFSRKSFAGAQSVNNDNRLPIDSTNSPFYFVHSPLSWFFVETKHGFELLPTVTAVSRQAGVGGMEMKRGGGVDDMLWLAKKTREENCIVIPMDYKYDGESGYINEWKNKSGKSYYTDRWTTPDRARKFDSKKNANTKKEKGKIMNKQDKDRAIVESITNRFVKQNKESGKDISREQVRSEVVAHMVRRDRQGKNQ